MSKTFLIVLQHGPYGRLDAAEAVRHLNGAASSGLRAAALLLGDGVYLAKAGQRAVSGWTDLGAALARTLQASKGTTADAPAVAAYAHGPSLEARGLRAGDLVAGCAVADDATAADLLTGADFTLVY